MYNINTVGNNDLTASNPCEEETLNLLSRKIQICAGFLTQVCESFVECKYKSLVIRSHYFFFPPGFIEL